MSRFRYLMMAAVAGVALAGAACSDQARAETKSAVDQGVAAAASTGAEASDGWITAKIKAKFADETVLEGSKISVETNDHVVSLRGTVLSDAGRTRAVAIARGTERVTRVADRLVVE